MKIERTKNAYRNMVIGMLFKIYQLAVPFLMRTVMIYVMGAEYLGLNSLFTSILEVLNLAELGVGSAMVFSMYKPIAEDDDEKICALMRLYKIYYRIIGSVILIIGLFLTPFIPKLIKSDVPADMNVYILYIMNLFATVLTYWLFAYKNSVLYAHQRTDIGGKIGILTNTIKCILQIIVLVFWHNYYFYVMAILITQILNNVLIAQQATKLYPQYQAKGKLPKTEIVDINHRIRDLFTSKVGTVIVNSADTIVISAFLGLKILAIYQNYFYLITAVKSLINVIFNSCTAGIGNSLLLESKEKNFFDFKKMTFLISWITGFCAICFLCLFQPFIELWVGKDLMLSFSIVICLCCYFYILQFNSLFNLYKDAAGIWHDDRFRPLVTALANLIMNLIMVNYWGLYGIILSTILSTVIIGMPWLLHNLFTSVFEMKQLWAYLTQILYYTVITIVVGTLTYMLCTLISLPTLLTLIVRLLICCVVPNICFYLVYHKTNEFANCIVLVSKISNGKLKFLNKFIKRV